MATKRPSETLPSNPAATPRRAGLSCATSPAGPVTVAQQGTYQPDTTHRWMGSAAMDQQGNIALGYSASSSSINPQIRYAGQTGERSGQHSASG